MGSNPTLALTIKTTPGGLSAGYIPPLLRGPTTNAMNFPALPNSAGFPYAGIS